MKPIAESSVRRLALYLRYLERFEREGRRSVASGELAACGGTTSAQVRKDLSVFGSFGKRGLGYDVGDLAQRIRTILGLDRTFRVVILGAGKIGGALAQYHGFSRYGFTVVGAYDVDPARIGQRLEGITVRPMDELAADAGRLAPDIAVLAVPASAAQDTADRAVAAGLRALLNFAAATVQVPPGIEVRQVDMALELEVLAYSLTTSRAAGARSRSA